jgi:hypothetical protein
LQATRKTLHWLFTRTEAIEAITRCPTGNLAAKALAKAINGEHLCTLPNGWVKDGKPIPADIFSLTIQHWMKTAPGLCEKGHWFHERLKFELDRLGIEDVQHADDDTHNRYVGAAYEMFAGGQPEKAALFYNRMASMAGWRPLLLVSVNPTVEVDIGTAILVMRGDDFFVVPPQKSTQ